MTRKDVRQRLVLSLLIILVSLFIFGFSVNAKESYNENYKNFGIFVGNAYGSLLAACFCFLILSFIGKRVYYGLVIACCCRKIKDQKESTKDLLIFMKELEVLFEHIREIMEERKEHIEMINKNCDSGNIRTKYFVKYMKQFRKDGRKLVSRLMSKSVRRVDYAYEYFAPTVSWNKYYVRDRDTISDDQFHAEIAQVIKAMEKIVDNSGDVICKMCKCGEDGERLEGLVNEFVAKGARYIGDNEKSEKKEEKKFCDNETLVKEMA